MWAHYGILSGTVSVFCCILHRFDASFSPAVSCPCLAQCATCACDSDTCDPAAHACIQQGQYRDVPVAFGDGFFYGMANLVRRFHELEDSAAVTLEQLRQVGVYVCNTATRAEIRDLTEPFVDNKSLPSFNIEDFCVIMAATHAYFGLTGLPILPSPVKSHWTAGAIGTLQTFLQDVYYVPPSVKTGALIGIVSCIILLAGFLLFWGARETKRDDAVKSEFYEKRDHDAMAGLLANEA
eukprot:m.248058 g.248058  ORF g.248058 m.248058 type:complete len:238 (+) comp15407_c1_seq1:81-794(+)